MKKHKLILSQVALLVFMVGCNQASRKISSVPVQEGKKIIYNMHGEFKFGVVAGLDGESIYINDPFDRLSQSSSQVLTEKNIYPYNSVNEIEQSSGFLGFGEKKIWSIGDVVMIEWSYGVQKATIGDLTADGLVYFSEVSSAIEDSLALGNVYFELSIIRDKYIGVNKFKFDNKYFRIDDTVLIDTKINSYGNGVQLHEGSIIDLNSAGELRVDLLNERDRFYKVSSARHLEIVPSLEVNGKKIFVGQEVRIKGGRGTDKTRIIKIDSSGYVLVEKFNRRKAYLSASELVFL